MCVSEWLTDAKLVVGWMLFRYSPVATSKRVVVAVELDLTFRPTPSCSAV